MTQLRFKGPKSGTSFTLSNVSIGASSGNIAVAQWLEPDLVTDLPLIINATNSGRQRDGETLSLLTPGLTNITAYQWQVGGVDIPGASGATYLLNDAVDGTTGANVTCNVTCDQGVLTTPACLIYSDHAMASHNTDDDALLALVPGQDVTHVAIADGNWSAFATWQGGNIPDYGAVVLIPAGRTVIYDIEATAPRLDRVRVDGELTWATQQSTQMLVETLLGTRGSVIRIATAAARLPEAHTAEIIISDRDYRTDSRAPTDIDIARDTRLWGRGIITQGTISRWGAEKTAWLRSAEGAAPMAGATSVTLEKSPIGWNAGDTIVIGGTAFADVNGTSETETRTITGVSGAVISWVGALTYDHDHQNANALRSDLQPGIGNLTRNIVTRSESPGGPTWQRGHTAVVHGAARCDEWGCEFRDLGRTRKNQFEISGTINGSGDFEFPDGTTTATTALSADANLQSRYPCHLHHVGFGKAVRDVIVGCAVQGSPGWSMVHHGCEADLTDNVIYDFAGAGMVSESGNELGAWVGNLAIGSRNKDSSTPKDEDGNAYGLFGDFFRTGHGFAMRGRAMRTNRNFAMDVSWGHVFFHREAAATISPSLPHQYAQLDLANLQGVDTASTYGMDPKDYPIVHFSGNEAAGTFGGLFVTKPGPAQNHGLNINLKKLKSWGFVSFGGLVEYIGQYALTEWDCVANGASKAAATGIAIGNNAYGVAVVRSRTTECDVGVQFQAADISNWNPQLSPTTEARFMVEAHEGIGNNTDIQDANDPVEMTIRTTEQNYIEPSTSLPFIVADWDGTTGGTGGITNPQTATLSDTLNAAGILPKPFDPVGLPMDGDGLACALYALANGYYTYGGDNILVFPLYFSDRLSAVPIIEYHALRCTGSMVSYTNNGAFVVSANAPAVAPAVLLTSEATSGTLDILGLASDSDGNALNLLDSFYNPDHGRLEINEPAPGQVRYTPDADYEGTDLGYVWVDDGSGHATRVDLDIRVGISAPQIIQAADWTLAQASGNAITITLAATPDTGQRRIKKVEYSTDGGTSWARLCYHWIPGAHIKSTASSGAGLTSGQGLSDVQLRYLTDLGDLPGSDSKSITLD